MSNPKRSEQDITTGLMAMVAYAGNAHQAALSLKESGKLNIGADTLRSWVRERYAARYIELREKHREQLEAQVVGEFRDVIRVATDVARKAMEKADERLDQNKDQDPARTAANAATVADKLTGKMLVLSNRPSNITEQRSPEEIIRKLAGMGVVRVPNVDADVGPEGSDLPTLGTPAGPTQGD